MLDKHSSEPESSLQPLLLFAFFLLIPALVGVGLSALVSSLGNIGTVLQVGLFFLSVVFGLIMAFSPVSGGLREYGLMIAFAAASFAIGVGMIAYFGVSWTSVIASLVGGQVFFWSVMLLFFILSRRQKRL